ncbi:organic solute transporter subunit beta [Ochotona princeps]|uniref:organic solute transporter subunit beta n=1 Tax=Ochotona princeps TaxID=9978 RepID=UPI002714E093|nr:organic solute transporter subunit beta [Ochotona princeps]
MGRTTTRTWLLRVVLALTAVTATSAQDSSSVPTVLPGRGGRGRARNQCCSPQRIKASCSGSSGIGCPGTGSLQAWRVAESRSQKGVPSRRQVMDPTEVALTAPPGTAVPQELLAEMLWFFRMEDASPWNYSILALTVVVVGLSIFLLIRNIQGNRNRKMQQLEKAVPEALYLKEVRSKEGKNQNNLRESLLSEKLNWASGEMEFKDSTEPPIFLRDPAETAS